MMGYNINTTFQVVDLAYFKSIILGQCNLVLLHKCFRWMNLQETNGLELVIMMRKLIYVLSTPNYCIITSKIGKLVFSYAKLSYIGGSWNSVTQNLTRFIGITVAACRFTCMCHFTGTITGS